MSGWRCFVITPSPYCRRALRRYASGSCPVNGSIHDRALVIDPQLEGAEEGGLLKGDFAGDLRWPKACACGREFSDVDHWQVRVDRLYSEASDGKLHTLEDKDLPAGAMWEAPWLGGGREGWVGEDGKSWVVKLPSGMPFPIDGPSADGGRWARTGVAPLFSVTPSIHEVGRYHGHLANGILTPCVEGNKFPDHPETA